MRVQRMFYRKIICIHVVQVLYIHFENDHIKSDLDNLNRHSSNQEILSLYRAQKRIIAFITAPLESQQHFAGKSHFKMVTV